MCIANHQEWDIRDSEDESAAVMILLPDVLLLVVADVNAECRIVVQFTHLLILQKINHVCTIVRRPRGCTASQGKQEWRVRSCQSLMLVYFKQQFPGLYGIVDQMCVFPFMPSFCI